MWKAVEVMLIWVVAIVLAVPEAIAFDMVELNYREQILWVCMLSSEQKSSFMMVRIPLPPLPAGGCDRVGAQAHLSFHPMHGCRSGWYPASPGPQNKAGDNRIGQSLERSGIWLTCPFGSQRACLHVLLTVQYLPVLCGPSGTWIIFYLPVQYLVATEQWWRHHG